MDRNEVMNTIRTIVYQVLRINIEDENDNILGCHHKYPVAYAIYIVERLEKIYGKGLYEIFAENDYTIWKLSNLTDAIIKVCSTNQKEVQE
ncbi:hypothetical protein [Anaeromicropila populeti]|uniref:Uncharacterized protein n=1 Tax=Anaeromicropila populeti TaxID=37658 RepID=A0A1I6IDF0_9FIRM|nr:hypothetical protein [Anaeromicropila populeti]SFR64731.1 hypothetical protein SAMN05661086_00723 [Anaeromicropila populeti]